MRVKSFRGFSLVELMVALLISSILLGGVITMLSISKRTYNLQDELSVLQDNARFVIDELTRQIRMAGYRGCSNSIPIGGSVSIPSNPFADSRNEASTSSKGFPSSDQLVIAGFGELLPFVQGTALIMGVSNIPLNPQAILPPNLTNPKQTNQIIVSDCNLSNLVDVTAISNNTLTISPLVQDFTSGPPEIFNGIQETIYKVDYNPLGLYRCQDNNPDGECSDYSLFVEGVQSMQIRYGVPMGSQIQFNATTSDNVIAVHVTLLMRTPHKRGIPQTTNKTFFLDASIPEYQPLSQNLTNEEGFRHRLYSMTIAVRNNNL